MTHDLLGKSSDSELKSLDVLTIYAMMREMNESLMTQAKATNNNVAKTLAACIGLQGSISKLIESLTDTRDKRYQEEIDVLEAKLNSISKELLNKQAAKVDNRTTSEKLLAAAKEAVTDVKAEESKRMSFDWIDARNKVAVALMISLTLAVVYYVAPYIGKFIQAVFGG